MTKTIKARTEFAAALNQICAERGIKPEVVLDSVKQALLAAYRKDAQKTEEEIVGYEVILDPDNGAARILKSDHTDVTPAGFGRIAAQTAKQIILQRNREAEKDSIIAEYKNRIGTIVNGIILRFESKTAVVDIGRGQAWLTPEEQAQEEYYRVNQRLVVLVKEIRETPRGEKIIVSRRDSKLVEELFAREVPEVSNKAVVIKSIAREAGRRTKIAVDSTEDSVDPVGSCVGQKGVRVQAVTNQLGGEKIDIIGFNRDPKEFIKAALAPAEGMIITLDEKKKRAKVVVSEDQQPIAIGRGGQNVRLASILTGWEIDVVSNISQPISQPAKSTAAPKHGPKSQSDDKKSKNKKVARRTKRKNETK